MIFLLGCDNNISPEDIPKDSFVVYIVFFVGYRVRMEIKEHSSQMLFYLHQPTPKEQELMVLMMVFSQY